MMSSLAFCTDTLEEGLRDVRLFLFPMNPMYFLLLAMVTLGIIVLLITILVKKHMKSSSQPPEQSAYLTFFILGITFLPMGLILSISTDGPGFYGITVMGTIFLIIGLLNRDKWDEGKRP